MRIADETSQCMPVSRGVPQGSILGPILFACYTSMFRNRLTTCESHFYADDTQIYHSFEASEVITACRRINSDLAALGSISRDFCLSVNPIKSKVMIFGRVPSRRKIQHQISIEIDGEQLPMVDQCRNLGLEMDTNFKYEAHVTKIVRSAYANLRLLYAHRDYLDQASRRVLTESLVLSHFNYADVVYGPSLTQKQYLRLQRVQNSCVRFIYGLRKYDHVSEKYKELQWLRMRWRMIHHSCCLFQKIIATHTPPYLYDKITFRTDVHNINVRHKNSVTIPKHKTKIFQGSFTYFLARCDKIVPVDIKRLRFHGFKKILKTYLLKSCDTINM